MVAPELFLSANLGFVRETGLLGGSHLLGQRWARRQERKQQQWSAIDFRLHTTYVRGPRVSHSKTPNCSPQWTARPLTLDADPCQWHVPSCFSNCSRPHESVISLHIQSQNSAPPSKWKPGCLSIRATLQPSSAHISTTVGRIRTL